MERVLSRRRLERAAEPVRGASLQHLRFRQLVDDEVRERRAARSGRADSEQAQDGSLDRDRRVAVDERLHAAGGVWHFTHRADQLPDPPALVLKVREVARLETLDVSLYKKIDFSPDPQPSGSTWGDVVQWASYSLRPPRGRAIIFADAHLGVDLRKLDVGSLRVSGRKVQAVLPPTRVQVELRPAETEIIGSNLDSKQTAELFERARTAFEREVAQDPKLAAQARASAEQTLRSLFVGLGFTE